MSHKVVFLFMSFSDKPHVIWKGRFAAPYADEISAGIEDSERESKLLSSQLGEGHSEAGRQAVNSGIS